MNDTSPLVTRLAAANPLQGPGAAPDSIRSRIGTLSAPHRAFRPRRSLVAGLALAAVALPSAAFAHQLGDLLGLTNEGTSVATSSLPESQATKLGEAMQEMAWPGQMQLLGTRAGYTFYATRKANGEFCFAIGQSATHQGVGCDETKRFPSAQEPIVGFPVDAPQGVHLLGFAADGVATVEALDADGQTLLSAPVEDNIYAASADQPAATPAALVALDAAGNVLYRVALPFPH